METTTFTPSLRRFGIVALALAGGVLAGIANPVSAATVDGVPSAVVRFADLNLDSEAGSLALYHRLAAAAGEVCPAADVRDLHMQAVAKACQVDAIRRAAARIQSPRLTALIATRATQG